MRKRQRNHEGSIHRSSAGYRASVMLNGKRYYGPTVSSPTEARPALWAKLASRPAPTAGPPLSSIVPAILAELERRHSPHYHALHDMVWHAHAEQRFGALAATDVDAPMIELWRAQLEVSNATRNRYARALVKLLAMAGRTVRVRKLPETPSEPDCLDPGRAAQLLALEAPPRAWLIVRLGLQCGLGISEMAGLRHEDREEDGILIQRQTLEVRGRVHENAPLKTSARRAWIPLPPELLDRIGPPRTGYVLATAGGRPMRPTNIRRALTELVAGTALEGISPHDLRHTYGMRLLESGVDLRTAAELMRHDPIMLAKVYARSRRDLKRAALERAFPA